MKSISIRFFSIEENTLIKPKKEKKSKVKRIVLEGYVSKTGKLAFPPKVVTRLGFDAANFALKVGVRGNRKKAKFLFLVPAVVDQPDTFQLEKAAKSYTLSLPFILLKSGFDYIKTKYTFTIMSFPYEDSTAYGLLMKATEAAPKAPYTGKKRGRKPKEIVSAV